VKILLIVVVIAIVAGLYWLLRRSVLRGEQASATAEAVATEAAEVAMEAAEAETIDRARSA
jgi:uncharacterized protein (UPF0333 family)